MVRVYKDGDSDALSELIKRFKSFGYKEALFVFNKYKDVSKVEIRDLNQICMLSLMVALKRYKGNEGFYTFWKKIAYHNMMDEVKISSTLFLSDFSFREMNLDADIDSFIACEDNVSQEVSKNSLMFQVIEILEEKKYGFRDIDKRIFLNYIQGFSYTEISELYGLKYATVRQRIKRIVEKIRFILKYSEE